MVCGLWFMIYGLWYIVYGLWFVVCGLWFVVCGLWFVVCGLWFMVYGLWFMVYGLWFMDHVLVGAGVCAMGAAHLAGDLQIQLTAAARFSSCTLVCTNLCSLTQDSVTRGSPFCQYVETSLLAALRSVWLGCAVWCSFQLRLAFGSGCGRWLCQDSGL